jgi:redox-sensitive bicupin YhaK (pirin superfamily)
MIELRPLATLGSANYGWLEAKHHFSFADYSDPARLHWGSLRVWNDDAIQPGTGFPEHQHRDMEIITYVREGAITHRDSLGNVGRTEAGDVQVMSAGSGVRHSEYNREKQVTRIFQIWISPKLNGGPPAWGARPFPKDGRRGKFLTLASGMTGDDALLIRANARVCGATVLAGESISYQLAPTRKAYLVAAAGRIRVGGVVANARDGIAIADHASIDIEALNDSEIVLVDTD